MATTIMFANQKGGVGKTTSTFEISYLLSKKKYKVLMIDLDAQVNLSEISGADISAGKSIFDCLTGLTSFADAIQNIRPNLDILAGSRKMLSQRFTDSNDMYLLREAKEFIDEYKPYDFILIDVGPEGGQLMTMAMIASDYVVAVTTLSKLGYSGVVQMCADLRNGKNHFVNFNIKSLGILVNNVRKTNVSDFNREKFEELGKEFGASPFKTEIKSSCVVDECKEFSQALNEYDPKHDLSIAYNNLTKEIIKRIKEA